MDDTAIVSILHCFADLTEQAQGVRYAQFPAVAPLIDQLAVDVFHHHVGDVVLRAAAVEQTSDVRVVETGQDLPLISETAQHLFGSGVRVHQLDGDVPPELAVRSFGEVHRAHAAVTDLAQYAIGAGTAVVGRRVQRSFKEIPGVVGGLEKPFDVGAQLIIALAFALDERLAIRPAQFERGVEDLIQALPFRSHLGMSRRLSEADPKPEFDSSRRAKSKHTRTRAYSVGDPLRLSGPIDRPRRSRQESAQHIGG